MNVKDRKSQTILISFYYRLWQEHPLLMQAVASFSLTFFKHIFLLLVSEYRSFLYIPLGSFYSMKHSTLELFWPKKGTEKKGPQNIHSYFRAIGMNNWKLKLYLKKLASFPHDLVWGRRGQVCILIGCSSGSILVREAKWIGSG